MIWLLTKNEQGQRSPKGKKNLLVEHLGDIRSAIEKVSSAKKLDLVLNFPETQLGYFMRQVILILLTM